MARWLTRRGARHLILLSRSGPRTSEATGLVEELESQGVQVATPACDVTDKDRLRSVLDTCSESMPPVKGCVQASMVMSVRDPRSPSYEAINLTQSTGAYLPTGGIRGLEGDD